MCSTSIFPCIMTMISNFAIFFYLSNICFQIFLHKYNNFLYFHMIPAALLLIISFFFLFKTNYFHCLKIYKNFSGNLYLMLIHHAYFLCLQIRMQQTLKNLMEYVCLLLMQMIFQDYFYIHQCFVLYIQDLHK